MASSQHLRTNRGYRPTEAEYNGPGRAAVEAAGHTADNAVRAFWRWLNEDPSRLEQIAAHLAAVKAETPRGRPKRGSAA